MKKRVTVILEVETDDEINISDEFIRNDLKQEISCASNDYDLISIQSEVLDNGCQSMWTMEIRHEGNQNLLS